MFWTPNVRLSTNGDDPEKRSGLVCGFCDKRLGRENLINYANMTPIEASLFDKYLRETFDDDDPVSWEVFLDVFEKYS